jgi:hypothetical protein
LILVVVLLGGAVLAALLYKLVLLKLRNVVPTAPKVDTLP